MIGKGLVHSKHRIRMRGPHHPQHELLIQVEDLSIVYRVIMGDALTARAEEVLPPGTRPSKKGR